MADFVLMRKSRNILSNFLHVALNILLAVVSIALTVSLKTPVVGIVLVFLSKWRVLAVRPRFWWPNIKTSLVDLIVGISIVLVAYCTQSATSLGSLTVTFFGLQTQNAQILTTIFFSIFYAIWLLFIKPSSSDRMTFTQALIAVFLGMTATILGTTKTNAIVPVFLSFIIGYAATRHILSQSDDRDYNLATLVSGLIFAEITWLCRTWSIVYPVFGIYIPQASIILTTFVFVYNYVRLAMIKYQKDFRFKHILAPVVFGILLIGILVICFSKPRFDI